MTMSERQEIEAVAKQIWLDRGGIGGSAEDDWYRACEIVRKRNLKQGNSPTASESYVSGTGSARTDPLSKENAHMENTMTGSMENTGTGIGSRMSDMTSGVVDRVNNVMDTDPKSMPRMEHREGRVARTIEQQTAKIPSDAWLWAALGSMGLSLALELGGREKTANFVGHWVPTLLIFGLYNKMVKLQGSDGL
jgi:hypothetical protein